MESENAQEEDLTPNLIHQDVTKPKESSVPTDDNLLKSNYISAEKDNSSEMLFDSSAFVEQVGKVNGKVSEKEEEEEEDEEDSRNAEQLSQSSSSDDSSGSSDVSSSSSDDDVNLSSQNQWSSSVTCKGIKLSVKGIRSSDQTDDVRCESDDTSRPNRASFCDEVKSSRLSDDSSSSDSGGGSPPQSFSKPVNSNCNNSNSLEKDSLDVNQSPNSRHPNSTNFKGSISNFPSSNLSRFENSSLDQNSFNNSRNDRRSTDSVGSHLSLKSNDIFERKLSLSSDSSDSENSCNQLELDSIKSSLNPSVETNLLNSVKSITSDSNNSSFKPDLFNELSDSTCVKFNSVNTTRSPEKKITSPIKENSQGYSLLDRFSNTEEKTPTESIPNTINPQQKLTPSQLSLKLSNSSSPNSSQAPSFKLSNNGEERRSNFSDSFLSNSISKGKNVGVRDEADLPSQNSLAKTGIQQLEEELSLGNEKFSSVSVSNSSDSAGFKDSGAKTEPSRISDLVEPSRPVNVKNEEALPDVLNRVNNESEHISDLDLDFQSQDMGMEISSDSSLSSDEVSEEESGSHLNDLSDLSSQSRNSDREIVDSVSDIMGVIDGSDGKEMEKVSRETHVKEPEETMADVMKVIGSPSDKETKDPVDVMKVTGNTSDNETKDSAIDVMKVIGDASENETKYLVDDVLKVIGATSDEQVEKPLVDTLKVVDRSTRDESEESIRKVIGIGEKETEDSVFDVMKVIGVSNNLESNDTMSEVMKVIGVVNEKGVEDSTIGIKIAGGNDRQETDKTMADVMKVIGVANEKGVEDSTTGMKIAGGNDRQEADETMAEVMKVVGVANEKGVEDSTTGMKIAGGNDRQETDKTMADVMKIIGVSSEKETEDPTDDIAKVLDSSCSEKESDEPMEVDIMKVIGGSDFEMDESNEDLSVAKSQVTGVSSSQVSDTITKQSSLSVSGSDKTEDEVKFNSVEDTKAERSDRLSDVEKASSSGLISCNSSIVNQGNTTQTKPDSNLVNNCNEQLNSITNEDSNTEPEKAGSSDNILSIISKDLKTSNGTKSLSKTKRLLLKQKKGSIKFKKKLKLLKRLGSGYESNKSDAQVPGQEPGKPEEEPLAEYAQYLGLQPTLKFKCCICAQIGFQSYAELREHQKNCQASEAGRSSASSEKISPTKSTPCTNAEDINQTNFRITRKVYLCSACGTYYENWNLFLHMQEVHQRFICLLCLGMFTMSYKLSDHLILTHGVEVKSFQNLSDFRQAFNCALYVSCTDCGKTFSEGDNWSSHHCLFTCNVCSIKNGHLPRCPRNFFVKADETIADMKLPTKCIIRINPSSCATTTILPKRDDKCYDIASNFCSVDITEIGESSMEPSDSEKTESLSRPEKPLSIEQKSNPNTPAVCESNAEENSRIQNNNAEKESSSQQSIPCSSNVALNPDENESRSLDPSEDKEKKLETASNNSSTADEKTSSKEVISEVNDTNPSDLSGNHSNQGNESNEEETEKKSETSDLTSESESGSEDEKPKETSSVGSCELQKAEILDKPSDMKLIIKKSALNNPMFKLNTNPSKTEKASVDLGTDAVEKIAENKQDSSVFDPDYDLQTRPAQSRSVTSPVHDESHTEPVSCNPNSIVKESFDFKNRLNPDSKTQDPSALGFNSESEIRRESEKDSSFETSIESQPSDDSRMDYESDSQPHLSGDSKAANNIQASDAEKALSQSNDTSDSDSNRLSMVVDNNDQTTNSRPSPRGSPADEKMMIDYEGDNAVDNADVGQSESNYNSFSSDQGSPLKVANFDGITLAAEDVTPLTLPLSGPLDTMALNTIVKECVRVSCTSCAYCNHALKIAVNAKELVLHLLAEHRYTPAKDEDSPVKLVSTLKNGVNSLESVFFNTDSYDSSDKSSNLSYDGTFSCFQCPFWTLQHKDLYTHKRKMHQKTILLCVMCKSNFYSYSELLCHMCPGTYQPNDILFRCCFCHIDKIPSAFRLMVHIRKIHHTCEICLDVSTDQQKLATHMWKHKLHHLCYRCGIAYRNKPDITRHLFWKHGTESVLCKKCLQKKWPHVYHFCIPPATVVCDECNATFTRTVALRVHKRLHTNEKPHACTQCEEKFISKKILAKHELSHLAKEDESAVGDVEKKENYDPTVAKNLLGITDPPVQIQKTDEKQNIDVDDETVPVIRIKKNKSKKSKPMLDLTALPPLNLSSESDSEPEPPKPAPAPETVEVKSEAEDKFEVEDKSDKPEAEDKSAPETTDLKDTLPMETEVEEKKENIVECTDSQRLEIILADHDYCKPQSEEKEISETKDTKLDTSVDLNSSLNATLDTKDASASDSSPTKRKSKSPKKKLNKSSNSSSSSSSSDTDSSSCSCGPNCSCSSSSSDSSTSTSSDSDSSNPENRRKQEERRQKRRERAKTKSPKTDPEPVISVENEEMYILESDLETDITLTDEDFYDEYPQQHANKMLAEKQESDKDQLMLLASVAPTHTAPSSPVVSAEEAPAPAPQPSSSPKLKKRLKTKRKRDETLVPASAPHGAQSILESKLTQLPPSMPSLITKLPNPNARNYTPMSQTPTSEHFSDRTLSTGGSGSESESKRSKRRRVKNKFYGYSSEEENPTESSKPRFKPKKLKKVIAVRKPEPTLTRPNPFNVSLPIQPAAMSVQQSYQPYQPTVTVKPVVPSASNVVRSTLPPVRHRPPSPFSSSDSDDDKLNIDEKYEPPQATLTPTLAAALAAPPQPNATKNTNLYCYCQCPYDEVSEMIACDGDNCRIEWFHFECVGIMVPPKGQWFCPDCRKKKNLSY